MTSRPYPVPIPAWGDHSIRRRAYSVALAGGDVDASVKGAFTLEGIKPGAEGTGYDPLYRPQRWCISHVDPCRPIPLGSDSLSRGPCMISPDIAEERSASS